MSTTTKTSIRYEHRLIKEHNAGDYYGKDLIFEVGKVLEKTKTPHKRRYYGVTISFGVGFDIPTEKVGVFEITRTVTETEIEL